MEPGDVRVCPCGGLIQRVGAVVGCRRCGKVYAMYLSTETRTPAKYLPHPEPAPEPAKKSSVASLAPAPL